MRPRRHSVLRADHRVTAAALALAGRRIRSPLVVVSKKRGVPKELRCCPRCGLELTKRQLKLALIDRIEHARHSGSQAALELLRALFPEDNPTSADNLAGRLEAKRQRGLYPPAATDESL